MPFESYHPTFAALLQDPRPGAGLQLLGQDELFITATTSLYRVRLATRGCQYSHLLGPVGPGEEGSSDGPERG
jgi:hypothetical protein